MKTFAINLIESNVGMINGRYQIPAGGNIALYSGDEKHPEVEEAIRRGWIKLSVTDPGAPEQKGPKIVMTEPIVRGSTTIPKKTKKEAV